MASLKEVASEVGVSIAAASIILNSPHKADRFSEECIREVKEAAKRLNYHRNHRAGSLRAGKAHALGVMMPVGPGKDLMGDPYWGGLMSGLDIAARESGYEVVIIGEDSERSVINNGIKYFRERRVDGLIMPVSPSEEEMESVYQFEGPLVVLNRPSISNLPNVSQDEMQGTCVAVEHLVGHGHKSIAWMGPNGVQGSAAARRRDAFLMYGEQMGFQSTVLELESDEKVDLDTGIRNAKEKLAGQLQDGKLPFTAILAYNEICARGVYEAVAQANLKIPEDLSVIGYDDFYARFFSPMLTSVKSPVYETGLKAGQLLLRMIKDKIEPKSLGQHAEVNMPNLIVRDSTGPVRS